MKKIISKIGLAIVLSLIVIQVTGGIVYANNSDKMVKPSDFIQKIHDTDKDNNPEFTDLTHPDAPSDYEASGTGKLLSPIYFGIDLLKYFMSGIAVIVIIIQGIKMVFSDDEETWTNSKSLIKWGGLGLILIQLSTTLVQKMFFGTHGEVLDSNSTAQIYAEDSTEIVRQILGAAELVMAAVAVMIIVYSGFKIAASAGDEDEMGKQKNRIIYGVVGLLLIILSEVIVRGVVFPDNGKKLPSAENATFIIVGLVNYISLFTGFIAFISLLYAGYLYVVGGGNEDSAGKVKQIFIGSLIGMLLSLGSYAIVNTMVNVNKNTEEVASTQY